MQGPKFRYRFRNRAGLSYYTDDLNSIQLSQNPVYLKYTPKEWKNLTAGIYHNEEYRGNFKKITTPMQFVRDGKKILDTIAIYDGRNGFLQLVMEVQVSEDFSYQPFFTGTIDFKEYQYGEVYSTANIRENSLIDIIDAKKDLVMDIPLTADNSGKIQLDGIRLVYQSDFAVDNGFGTDEF